MVLMRAQEGERVRLNVTIASDEPNDYLEIWIRDEAGAEVDRLAVMHVEDSPVGAGWVPMDRDGAWLGAVTEHWSRARARAIHVAGERADAFLRRED